MSQPSLDFGDPYEDAAEPTFTVRQLADAINHQLRRGFGDGVWVRGEVTGLRRTAKGHLYFSLRDRGDDGDATLDVSLFAGVAGRLAPLLRRHRLTFEDGMSVRVFGTLDFFAGTGRLSLRMAGIDATFTLGRLAAERDLLLRRLESQGLLGRNARRALPAVPLRLGVVASRGSAAWHDVIHELRGSGLAFRLVVADTRVQGERAAASVANAVRALSERAGDLDALLLVRGGGSRTDLATFDTEVVAHAIASCRLPVLTGLGHEVDRSVADACAHTAFKTPTACAAFLVERVRAYLDASEAAWTAVRRRAGVIVAKADALQPALDRRLALAVRTGVTGQTHRLQVDVERLRRAPVAALRRAGERADRGATALGRAAPRRIAVDEQRVAAIAGRVDALDPARALRRGWSITRTADGRLVRAVSDAPPGTRLVTTVGDGTVHSTVEDG
jgi:exodeoxyribonuclease VII large subunit